MVAANYIEVQLVCEWRESVHGVQHEPAQDPNLFGDGFLGEPCVLPALTDDTLNAVTWHADLDAFDTVALQMLVFIDCLLK
ncbi:hypothetical protein A5N75_08330 [Prescottella equi]|nr:hypothetical protein A5N75_08330 [Prescottella equi]